MLTARASLAMNPSTKSFSGPRLAAFRSVTGLPSASVDMVDGFGRWLRPGPLRLAHLLERTRHLQHAEVVEAPARDLQPDRQARVRVAAVDRGGRLLRHVEGHGEADV